MFTYLAFYFFIYSFLAWLAQSVASSISLRSLHFHGFFIGPYSVTYGLIIIVILGINHLNPMNMLLTFVFSFILAGVLGFSTSFIMEKFFRIQWWDYSKDKFNFNSRIRVRNLFIVATSCVIINKWVQPWLHAAVLEYIPSRYVRVASSLIIGVMLIDLLISLAMVFVITEKLRDIKHISDEMGEDKSLAEIYEMADTDSSARAILDILNSTNHSTLHYVKRMINAKYANFHDLSHAMGILRTYAMYVEYQERKEEKIEKYEVLEGKRSFAFGLNFYKLFWIFVIGCIVGYIIETFYCLFKNGYIESRQGMIYGPFSQIYGIGAVLMSVVLVRMSKLSGFWIFIGSAIIGGVFEAGAAWIQEVVFNTTSWSYPAEWIPLFGGRTCLLYMVFWGALGWFFIRAVYPLLSRIIEKIPNKQGIIISWILIVFLIFDITISGIAVYRWQERSLGVPPNNTITEFVDEYYNNAMMREIYPHMKIKTK